MSNNYFDSTANPISANSLAKSGHINNLRSEIEVGFDKLPDPDHIKTEAITYGVDSGTANNYAIALTYPITSYSEGLRLTFKALNTNNGPSTLSVDGLSSKAIKRTDLSSLQAGDIVTNALISVIYDGTQFQVISAVQGMVTEALAAQTAAETAQGLAEDAQSFSETAQGLSETAQGLSETAQGLSEDARDASQIAQGLSENAQAYSEEWAQKAVDSPISIAAGGDGLTDFSAKHWAFKASDFVGFPDKTGNAGKALLVSNDESSVEWGQGGGKNYNLPKESSIKICDNVTNLDVSILTSGNPFFISTDNVTWELKDGYSDTITGDLYIGGGRSFGWYDETSAIVTYGDICFLNGNLYKANGNLTKYDGISDVILAYSSENGFYASMSDGTDIYAFDQNGDQHYKYTGGDVTAPTALVGYPAFIVGAAYYDNNMYLLDTGVSLTDEVWGAAFANSGNLFVTTSNDGNGIVSYPLAIPYDITTAGTPTRFYPGFDAASGMAFNTTGTKMFVLCNSDNIMYEFALSTAWDIASATETTTYSVTSQESVTTTFCFNAAGTKLYIAGTTGDDITQYSLSIGFDLLSTITLDGSYLHVSGSSNSVIAFNNNGSKFFTVNRATDLVTEYDVSSAYDLNTASSSNTWDISSIEGNCFVFTFNSDGTRVIIGGANYDKFKEWSLSTGFDLSSSKAATGKELTNYIQPIMYKMDGVSNTILSRTSVDLNIITDLNPSSSTFHIDLNGKPTIGYSFNLITFSDLTFATIESSIKTNLEPFSSSNAYTHGMSIDLATGITWGSFSTLNNNGVTCPMNQASGAIVFGA